MRCYLDVGRWSVPLAEQRLRVLTWNFCCNDSHYGKAAGLNYDFSDILLEENEELGKYEELDDYLSLVNRMIVNVSLNQN